MIGIKELIKVLIIMMFIFFIGTSIVAAANPDGYICNHNYHTFGDKVMNGGVGNYGSNRRYFWMTRFNTVYQGYVRNAVSEWVNTNPGYPNVTTSISIRETTNKAAAMFEFQNSYIGSGVFGYTTF